MKLVLIQRSPDRFQTLGQNFPSIQVLDGEVQLAMSRIMKTLYQEPTDYSLQYVIVNVCKC